MTNKPQAIRALGIEASHNLPPSILVKEAKRNVSRRYLIAVPVSSFAPASASISNIVSISTFIPFPVLVPDSALSLSLSHFFLLPSLSTSSFSFSSVFLRHVNKNLYLIFCNCVIHLLQQ